MENNEQNINNENVEETTQTVENKEVEQERTITESELRKNYVRKKGPFKKIFGIFLWLVVLGWAAIVLFDYVNLTKEKDLMFCIEKGTNTYNDGSVDWCKGPGYIVYRYKRSCFTGMEFGPFWKKDRSVNEPFCNQ